MEVLGMCLITNAETKRAIAKLFIFRGDGGNGKGTLLQVISKILGSGNVTNLSIKNLTDTYAAADMIGKLANLGDDIEGSTLDDEQVRMLKNISTCDTFKVREIYKAPVMMTMTATMIFTTNNTIRTFEKSNAISRRIRWLPMFSKVDKPDPLIITKLTTKKALEYWMSLIVPGYMRLYKNTSFSHCAVIENYTADYQEENDLALKWIKDTDPEEDIHNHTMKDVKQSFTNWIEDSGEDMPKYISSRQLKQTIWNQLKMGVSAKKVGKSTSRIFMKSNETDQIIEPK
jgi:putative DNA primase/helicase